MNTAKSAMNAVANLVHFEEGIIAGSVVRFFVVVAVVKRCLGKIWDLVGTLGSVITVSRL